MMLKLLQLFRFLWASPYTAMGLLIGAAVVLAGGRARLRGRTVEFHGQLVTRLFSCLPTGEWTLAMTLGHVILAKSAAALDITRQHELVHVKQYERWGPFMGPAYLMASLYLWCVGRQPYRDNPFEREAFGRAGEP